MTKGLHAAFSRSHAAVREDGGFLYILSRLAALLNGKDLKMTYEYFYGSQSESFSFYRIPRLLVTDPRFKDLSAAAKLLYGLLLDRMGLSARNGWYDEQNRVFIYYTLDEIGRDLCCGHDKATKLLRELDSDHGIGLIERVKQGLGKPARIYVKAFVPTRDTSTPDCDDAASQTAEKPHSALRESRSKLY